MPALLAACLAMAAPPAAGPMTAGTAAERAGDPDAAQRAYREAWADPSARAAAAAALRVLYERGAVHPAVDEPALKAARAELGPAFLLTETRDFILLSDADQAWTRQRGAILERTRHEYFRVMDRLGAPVYPHEHKLLCILFQNFNAYRAFAGVDEGMWAEWVAGYYSPRTNRIVFYNDATSPSVGEAAARLDEASRQAGELRARAASARRTDQAGFAETLEASAADLEGQIKRERSRMAAAVTDASAAKTVHEAIHLLAFNTGLQRPGVEYPFWLSEGLAMCFETDNPSAGAFGPDHPSAAWREEFNNDQRAGTLMPIERLIGLTSVPGNQGGAEAAARDARLMYEQSRALFAYLYRYHRRKLGEFFGALGGQPPGPAGSARMLDLFRVEFGDPPAIGRRLGKG